MSIKRVSSTPQKANRSMNPAIPNASKASTIKSHYSMYPHNSLSILHNSQSKYPFFISNPIKPFESGRKKSALKPAHLTIITSNFPLDFYFPFSERKGHKKILDLIPHRANHHFCGCSTRCSHR